MLGSVIRRPSGLRLFSYNTIRATPNSRIKVDRNHSVDMPISHVRGFVYVRNGTQQPHTSVDHTQHHEELAGHAQEWLVALRPGLAEAVYLQLAVGFEEEFGRALKGAHRPDIPFEIELAWSANSSTPAIGIVLPEDVQADDILEHMKEWSENVTQYRHRYPVKDTQAAS